MGYTTRFEGSIGIDPPLSDREAAYLQKFAETRRMGRGAGPYFVEGSGFHGQGEDADIRDFNSPPECQPGLWCQWVPNEDGDALEWDQGEKFNNAAAWMSYLRTHFLGAAEGLEGKPAAAALDPERMGWLPGGHRMRGTIFAAGEDFGDVWKLEVRDEGVFVAAALDAMPPEVDEDSEQGWDAWDEAFENRLAEAEEGKYEWGPEERIPDFATEDMMREALSVMEKERIKESLGNSGAGRRAPRAVL